ncbi:peptide/nickel transport system permease protein [Aminobacter lissarensis]|uniref:Peptide/nickel transport system permease protein n=1 Tax=Aminobacter carboxidus TaxID=376165 RepID=A0A8E1WGI2_9HYPH|nr:ABC transporter permease [Aminobacter lissarensis]MBB6467111.1 peptide/nickel transport system permease protein [Aminobacter lissarensis]
MLRLVVSRLLYAAVILLGVILVVASLVKLVPGDPVDVIAAGNPGMSVQDMDMLRERMGLTRSVPEQFVAYLGGAIKGDLGSSIRQGVPVTSLIAERLPATGELAFWTLILAFAIAIPLGIITALKRDSWLDYAGTFVAVLGVSMPGFLLAVLMILWFSIELRWLPASGYRGSALASIGRAVAERDIGIFWNAFRYFILPSISLAFVLVAVNARLIRSAMLEVLQQDYITFAIAKGAPRLTIILRHALRNALLPIVTLAGLQMGALLSGTVVIETVFAWPGIGRLAVDSIQVRDYPIIQAVVLVSAALFISLNLIVDILYRFIDPRVRND